VGSTQPKVREETVRQQALIAPLLQQPQSKPRLMSRMMDLEYWLHNEMQAGPFPLYWQLLPFTDGRSNRE
jgi:hypothetical protein